MPDKNIEITESKDFTANEVVSIYEANKWSSAKKPDQLTMALKNSDTLLLARQNGKLIGLANAISDGYLVVYYPHLLIHPDVQGLGVGKLIMDRMKEKYGHLHQQILVSDGGTVEFYKKCGFEIAGDTQSMWVYKGGDH
ncbi:MAG: GNAT family N-acetyltransferase [Bacteroidota bacterium]